MQCLNFEAVTGWCKLLALFILKMKKTNCNKDIKRFSWINLQLEYSKLFYVLQHPAFIFSKLVYSDLIIILSFAAFVTYKERCQILSFTIVIGLRFTKFQITRYYLRYIHIYIYLHTYIVKEKKRKSLRH